MPYGKERRGLLFDWIEQYGSLTVNRRWCIANLKDPDLTKLIKSGKLIKKRSGSFGTFHTRLVVA